MTPPFTICRRKPSTCRLLLQQWFLGNHGNLFTSGKRGEERWGLATAKKRLMRAKEAEKSDEMIKGVSCLGPNPHLCQPLFPGSLPTLNAAPSAAGAAAKLLDTQTLKYARSR